MSVPIFPSRWPARHPDRIQLYSLATPNGQKVSVALEEMQLPYEAHMLSLDGDQFDPEFARLFPNAKIPAIIDPKGPGGSPMPLMESGAILLYLAEKASSPLLPEEPVSRSVTLQWLFFQVGQVGPFLGQFGHFYKYARGKTSDTYALERYTREAKRFLGVLNKRLAERPYLAGDSFTIADIATFPWLTAIDYYEGRGQLEYAEYTHLDGYVERCMSRPAVQRGVKVCQPASSG